MLGRGTPNHRLQNVEVFPAPGRLAERLCSSRLLQALLSVPGPSTVSGTPPSEAWQINKLLCVSSVLSEEEELSPEGRGEAKPCGGEGYPLALCFGGGAKVEPEWLTGRDQHSESCWTGRERHGGR